MELNIIGLNHKTAPLSLREAFSFPSEVVSTVLRKLHGTLAKEIIILSTCNRTEIYFYSGKKDPLIKWLAQYKNIPLARIKAHLYHFSNEDAVMHAFKVASGLDSMILGETQILGQMKQAAKLADYAGTQKKHLSYLFQKVFEVAKEVRTKTKIGASTTTVASSILKVAKSIFGNIEQTSILFVGAGEMAELCAKYFASQKPKKITIANRSIDKGQQLANKIACDSILIGDINHQIHHYDIVISSTSSQLPIIGLGMIEKAIKIRKHKPMLLVDLAIPRDIEMEAGSLDDIFLYTFDDLAKLAQEGIWGREVEAEKAQDLLKERAKNFKEGLNQKTVIPSITRLRGQFEVLRKKELLKANKEVDNGAPVDEVMEKLSRNLSKKLLHQPTKVLNELSSRKLEEALELFKKIYKVED